MTASPSTAAPAKLTAWWAAGRQFATFAAVGVAATGAFFATYNLLRLAVAAYAANAAAILISSLFSFVANRRLTFQRRGRHRWLRQLLEFAVVFGVTLGISSAALAGLFALRPAATLLEENLTILAASGALFVARFWLLRVWVFHPRR